MAAALPWFFAMRNIGRLHFRDLDPSRMRRRYRNSTLVGTEPLDNIVNSQRFLKKMNRFASNYCWKWKPAKRALVFSAVALLATGRVEPAAPASASPAGGASAEAEAAIFDRQQIMLQLDRDSETLGLIAAGAAPAAKLAETTRAIAEGARDSVTAFQPKVPGGRSKPEVWSNNADFMRRMEAFAANADKMAKLGETGNVAAVTAVMIDALPCKACHDLYRAPKK